MCRLVYILPTLNPEARYRLHTAVVEGPEGINDRGIKGIFGEVMACLARCRLHAAVVGAPERIDDRGMKGIFGEYVVCLARFRLRAAEIGGFLFVF